MKKLLFILGLFPLLMQAQEKEEAIMVLPDLLVKGEVVNGQQTNNLIITNYLNGSLLSRGSKTPAVFCKDSDEYKHYFKDLLYCVVHLKGHVQGCFFMEFVIKRRKITISYIQGFDEDVIKEEIASIGKLYSLLGSQEQRIVNRNRNIKLINENGIYNIVEVIAYLAKIGKNPLENENFRELIEKQELMLIRYDVQTSLPEDSKKREITP